MRSLLMTTALLAVAVMSTGCSFTVSTPCTTFSHQSRLTGECGCGAGESCGQPECAGVDFGEGMPAGFESFSTPTPAPSMGPAPAMASEAADCGCDSCADAMPAESMTSPVSTDGPMAVGMQGGGLLGGGGLTQGGGLLGGGGAMQGGGGGLLGKLSSGHGGCGRFGCGRSGKLCFGCKAKSRFGGIRGAGGGGGMLGGGHTKPYGGDIPHTQMGGGMGPGMGGGQAPQYVYPYYTTRGPRDFLMSNPPSIGY